MPEPSAMYPEGYSTSIDIGELGNKLCGQFRPDHFNGVATVVAKLFNIVMPVRAYFGQKDYQQSLVIRKMREELNFTVEVVTCPTRREQDGLAMSSRNAYLSAEQRKAAAVINRGLNQAADALRTGASPDEASRMLRSVLEGEPQVNEIQYAGVYDPVTLEALDDFKGRAVLAVAVLIGKGRLIDNLLI